MAQQKCPYGNVWSGGPHLVMVSVVTGSLEGVVEVVRDNALVVTSLHRPSLALNALS